MARDLGGLAALLAPPNNSVFLCTCWEVERADGAVFRFTDHDRDLRVGGERFRADHGYKRTAVQSAAGGAVDEMEIEGIVRVGSVTGADVRRGLWDYAQIRIFAVDWRFPDAGRARLRRGWIGEVTYDDRGLFRAELRGMQQLLAQNVGEIYAPECRAQLGDHRCKVDLSLFAAEGVVGAVTPGGTHFQTTGLGAAWAGGVLEFTSGANEGVRREILDVDAAAVRLFLPLPYEPAEGDTYRATQGCDHMVSTCKDRFGNVHNFRGEPFVPGADSLLWQGIPEGSPGGGEKK